jgi:hypothetical protein
MLRQSPGVQNLNSRQALYIEILLGLLRLFLLIITCFGFAWVCIYRLEGANLWQLADQLKIRAYPWFFRLPLFFWLFLVPFQDWLYLRYLFAPFGAFLLVFVGSTFYVRDIYHLPTLSRALHYVFSSLFALFYPVIRVDGGRIDDEDPDDETNLEDRHLLRAIGGPGFVRIQPGNAVAFRDWRRRGSVQSSQLYFMRPFEMIAKVVNLEDQHGHIDEAPAITRDGIRLRLRNIDYRYSVLRPEHKVQDLPREQRRRRNLAVQRSPAAPYPFLESAIESIAYSFAVGERGMDRWQDVVSRSVASALGSFIGSHQLDYLTAPRRDGQDPRRELRVELFASAVRNNLRQAGAELHWMDIGHFDIDDLEEAARQDPVDETRTRRWAANWIGDARTKRSYGEAQRLAYQELARAEAQAEMIMSITDVLQDVTLGPDQADTLRQIFLARTAQILEALHDGNIPREPPR